MIAPPPLRLAVLGCGRAAILASRALRGMPGVGCAYASRDPSRAAELSWRLGGARAFGSYEEALASPEVDAVLVATPPSSHHALARRALECGKHLVIEKPPALAASDLASLEAASRSVGRRVLVAEGVVGDLLFVHLNALKGQEGAGWRGDAGLAGGGAFFEGGIHWVDLPANLGPEVERVEGFVAGGTAAGSLERSVLAVFRYATGAVATLSYSWEVPSPLRGLRLSRVYGREGSIAFESNGSFVIVWGRRRRLLFPGVRDVTGRRAMWADFVAAMRAGREPESNLGRARRDLELVEAVYRSAAVARPGAGGRGPEPPLPGEVEA